MHKRTTDTYIDTHKDEVVASLQRLIACGGVKAPASAPNAPFGCEVRASLDECLELSRELGFKVVDLDGYCGYVEIGSGEEMLGILCHLDVVPAGEGWKYPAFGGEVHDDCIFGRGTMDDKGPAVAALYGMAAVKEAGIPLRRRVRLILGCDEESGMECLKYYKKHAELPTMSFSPDADYPLVNYEKNGYNATFSLKYDSKITVNAGERVNVVPGICVATAPVSLDAAREACIAFTNKFGFEAEFAQVGEEVKFTVHGKNSHASLPQHGKNAMQGMIALLNTLNLPGKDGEILAALYDSFKIEMHGETFGLDLADDYGKLTLNPGIIEWGKDGVKCLVLDIRAPINVLDDEITSKLVNKLSPAGFVCEDTHFSKGYLVPKESELVDKLLKVYAARIGEETVEPMAIGGGTYARQMTNAVAFGCEIPGHDAFIHMPNEYVSIEDLIFNTKVMADAIVALAAKE